MVTAMLWVGQFGIVGGEAREESPWIGVYPHRGRGEAPSPDLYLLVEPALEGSEEFCGELVEAIGTVFHRHRLSLTGALLRALKAAHEHLRDWNRKSLREHQVAAGVSCLALQGDEGYLAQVAPACAFTRRAGSITRLEPTLPEADQPLGLQERFWPHFRHLELSQGDRILLLSPALAQSVPEGDLTAALALPAQEILPALYRRARAVGKGCALLIAAEGQIR